MDYSPPQMPFYRKGLRPHVDERTSAWVSFPSIQQRLLLPVIKRMRKIVPVFSEDGSIEITTKEPDPELGRLVDDFVFSTARAAGNLTFTLEAFAGFVRISKALILKNYDIPDSEIVSLLSMNEQDLSTFYTTLFKHCQGC